MTDEPSTSPPTALPARVDVVVLGAGPAGLLAAIEAANAPGHPSVLVLERRPFAGGQVPVAGGGRCNVTNAGSHETILAGFGRNGRWLRTALGRFDNNAVIAWFEQRGVPMKEEEHGKMFPLSDNGADVQNSLIREAQLRGAKIELRTRIEEVVVVDGAVRGVVAAGQRIDCGALVLAGGGGGPKPTPTSGVGLARALGHELIPPAPALAPIKLAGAPVAALSGVALVARLSAGPVGFPARKPPVSKIGELLFTHFGLSGPVVLDLSHPIARVAAEGPCEISLDLLPAVQDARAEIDRMAQAEGPRSPRNSLWPSLPRRIVELHLQIAGVPAERRSAELRATERDALVRLVKDWRFREFEVTWAGAMVTGGGVSLAEVDPKTMESRRIRGLFFAGEVLDLQGDCGGYNLQASFSTGALAGTMAAAHVASTAQNK